MLGYRDLKQFLRSYGVILLACIIGFIVRTSKFNEFTVEQHITITWISLILIIFFWEALRLTNYWLNKIYPFERNITWRIVLQLICGALIGVFIRFLVY